MFTVLTLKRLWHWCTPIFILLVLYKIGWCDTNEEKRVCVHFGDNIFGFISILHGLHLTSLGYKVMVVFMVSRLLHFCFNTHTQTLSTDLFDIFVLFNFPFMSLSLTHTHALKHREFSRSFISEAHQSLLSHYI